jgi:hypothetical protein
MLFVFTATIVLGGGLLISGIQAGRRKPPFSK